MNLMYFIKNIGPPLLFKLMLLSSISCQNSGYGQNTDDLFLFVDKSSYHYNLKTPIEKQFLPYVLEEISGMTYKGEHRILAIDDESGRLFEYDWIEKDIVHSIRFHKDNDYEGVELVGKHVYTMQSDGDLFRFRYSSEKETDSKKYETDLSIENDTEGLGYDPKSNELLIACKGKSGLGKKEIKGQAFYAFDLETKKLRKEPKFVIGPKQLEAFWESNNDFDYDKDRIKFRPSAIAAHPITNEYYILSSIGKMMVVTSSDGEIKSTYPISGRLLGQPEGICFAPNGDLYLSSEGDGDRGYILKFEMKSP